MVGSETTFSPAKYEQVWPGSWRDWQILGLLLVLALAMRMWAVWHTEVPARDSIGFIRYALRLEKENWADVLKSNDQHPGYPAAVLLISGPVRWASGGVTCESMQLSAQLASSLAGLLLVLPMFFLGKELFSRTVGFWAALLFQCMPGSGSVLSDAVSDPLFLCLAAAALLFAVRGTRGCALWPFALCGLFTGLAYLVRPEGALVVVAATCVLIGMQLVPRWRRSAKAMFGCLGVMIAGALIAGSPFFLVTHTFSTKPSASMLTSPLQTSTTSNSQADDVCGSGGLLFAVHLDKHAPLNQRMFLGIKAIGVELAHAFLWVAWLPAVLGLWWCRDRYRTVPGSWVVLVLFTLHTGLVWLLAVRVGYVSDRHILLLVLCSLFQAVAVAIQTPFRLAQNKALSRLVQAIRSDAGTGAPRLSRLWRWTTRSASAWALLLLFGFAGLGLSRTTRPLHNNRAGQHEAGMWLETHAQPADVIVDDHAWAHFYAGRVFREGIPEPVPPGHRPATYVVYTKPNEERHGAASPRAYNRTDLIEHGGQVVFQWPQTVAQDRAAVVIYRLDKPFRPSQK
jgi:hypothetical protein